MRLNKPVVGMAPTPNGEGLLARRIRRWDLRIRRRRVPRIHRRDEAQQADRRHGTHTRRGRATGSSRPTVGCSHSATPGSRARWVASSLSSPVTGIATTPDGGATGSSRPTAPSSPSVTPSYFGSASIPASNAVGITEGPGTGLRAARRRLPAGCLRKRRLQLAMRRQPAVGTHDRDRPGRRLVVRSGEPLSRQRPHGPDRDSSSTCSCRSVTSQSGPSQCDRQRSVQLRVRRRATRLRTGEDRPGSTHRCLVARRRVRQATTGQATRPITRRSSTGRFSDCSKRASRDVGIYSNRSEWASVTGGSGYSPYVPEWVSEWGTNEPPFDPAQYCTGYAFARGPTWLIQYTDGATTNGFDDDYAC